MNTEHHARLTSYLKGADIAFGGQSDASQRYLAPTVVHVPAATSDAGTEPAPLLTDEIFGPILPIVPMATADAAIDHINRQDKPLALYVFAAARATADRFVRHTSSGGVGIGAPMIQAGIETLPFGGVGASGMGCYHGRYSFEAFSHLKPVVRRPFALDTLRFAQPPFTTAKQRIAARSAGTVIA